MECIDGCNNVKVYNLTAIKKSASLLQNGSTKRKRKQKKSDADLIQDFTMPDVSSCLRLTEDGNYLLAAGIYKPTVKCYDFSQLSVKFERGMDAEVVRMCVLSEDYSQVAFLQEPRWLEIHNRGGQVYRKKVPYHGRDLLYDCYNCQILISNSKSDIYRFSTIEGRFLKEYNTGGRVVSAISKNDFADVVWCGTDCGSLLAIDPRMGGVVRETACGEGAVSSLQVEGFTAAVGTAGGQVLVYDVRTAAPSLRKDHGHGEPISALHLHSSGNVLSLAKNVLKIWDKTKGTPYTRVEVDEHKVAFNDMQCVPGTGMVLLATESPDMAAYFIPGLGPAPRWCSHLDAMMDEELEGAGEEGPLEGTVFVTREDLNAAGLLDLIGTSMAEASLHGWRVQAALYRKAVALAATAQREAAIATAAREQVAADHALVFHGEKPEAGSSAPKDSTPAEGAAKDAKKRKAASDASAAEQQAASDPRYGALFAASADPAPKDAPRSRAANSASYKRWQQQIARDNQDLAVLESSEDEDEAWPAMEEASSADESEPDSDADSVVDMMITKKPATNKAKKANRIR